MVSASEPPKETNIKGMSEAKLFEVKDTSIVYRCLVTEQDIDAMVEAYKQMKPFTFDNARPWPNVKIVSGEKIPKVEGS